MSLLAVVDLVAGHGTVEVLHGVSVEVGAGELVTLIGANGAGKTTLLQAISGLVHIDRGTVLLDDQDITGANPARSARLGLAHVPEGRRLFMQHTIEDNLRLAAYIHRRDKRFVGEGISTVYAQFPILGARRQHRAGSLSGGEQQMLALGMGLMLQPRLLMLDEPSLGLAPKVIELLFEQIHELSRAGVGVLLVEQQARLALQIADRGVVMRLGKVVAHGSAHELLSADVVRAAYLGSSPDLS